MQCTVWLFLNNSRGDVWCCRMYERQMKWVKMNVISVLLVTINSLCCVIIGLIVWYQYNPTPLRTKDSNKYAVIGSLQLWMLLVTNAAILITEVRLFLAAL